MSDSVTNSPADIPPDIGPDPRDLKGIPASEAIRTLTAKLMQDIGAQVNALSEMALRDAKLDPKDGWRYDPQNGVYVKQ